MQQSDIKLEEFGNCPGVDRIQNYLYEYNLGPYLEVVDLKSLTCKNSRDTLVLALLPGPTESQVALTLGSMAVEFNADDLNWIAIDGKYVVRLWWD